MKLPRKNKRGPIAGKPKPYKAEIVRLVGAGFSQSQIIEELEMPDEDGKRKIRRVMRELERATTNRLSRRLYEAGINDGWNGNPKDYLHIEITDFDVYKAAPELAAKAVPLLLTWDEREAYWRSGFLSMIENIGFVLDEESGRYVDPKNKPEVDLKKLCPPHSTVDLVENGDDQTAVTEKQPKTED